MAYNSNEEASGTPFDDVFKTETEKMGHLLVTVIEQMFHVEAEMISAAEMERLANEHYLIDETSGKISKRLSDSCFKVGDGYYHVECQSTEDGNILFRLAEYNVRIALEHSILNDSSNVISIQLPDSGLINLRSTKEAPKYSQMEIMYRYQNQSIVMPVPVMNVRSYTVEDIFTDRLYFLIPFYAIRYETRLRKISDLDDPEYGRIYRELKDFYDRLVKACESGALSENDTRNLVELSQIILRHITRTMNPELTERMVNLMGGHVLELQEDRWLKQGRLEGLVQGRLEGSKSLLYSLVKDKIIDVTIAAERAGIDEKEFIKEMNEYYSKQNRD